MFKYVMLGVRNRFCMYDPLLDTWHWLPPMPTHRGGRALVVLALPAPRVGIHEGARDSCSDSDSGSDRDNTVKSAERDVIRYTVVGPWRIPVYT